MFPEPHTAHPNINNGFQLGSQKIQKYDLEKQLGEMKFAYPKLIELSLLVDMLILIFY